MICKICNKEFGNMICLTQHINDVHKMKTVEYMEKYEGKIPLICDVCGENFLQK